MPSRRSSPTRLLAIGPFAAAVAVYLGEPLLRTAIFGTATAPLTPPAAGSTGAGSRVEVARIMLLEPSISGGIGSLRLLGALLLAVASTGIVTGRLRFQPARILLVIAPVCYLVAVFSSPIPGLLVAMPIFTAAAAWIPDAERRWIGPLAAAGLFVVAVIATSYDNAGGGDWGARYLFIGVPLLAIALVPAIERMVTDSDGRLVLIAAAACAVSVQVGVLAGIVERGTTVDTVDAVAATIDRGIDSDGDLVVAVSDERLSRFLYDRDVRGPVFHVPPHAEEQFLELDTVDTASRIMWVDLGVTADDRSGELVETHGSVSIRTEVRR